MQNLLGGANYLAARAACVGRASKVALRPGTNTIIDKGS